uniref:Uncharacterized protein n=2 Tax=Tanacetum cinerariifolium TaxID=118510 RepID=A0A699HZ69_TANCI|nr:hypothetical protein [Tanacetum cinerariifolium]
MKLRADEAVDQKEGDRVDWAITTDASLEAAQDSDNITKIQTMAMPTPNEPPLTEGHTSVSQEGRLEENIELTDTIPTPHNSPLTRGYTPGNMDKDENINLVSEQGEVQETAEHSRGDDDETLAETLLNIKRSSTKDKGKGIMQEIELPKKLKKKEMIQLSLDEELAQKLYAEELAKEEARKEQERYNLEKALELQRQLDQRKESVPKEID